MSIQVDEQRRRKNDQGSSWDSEPGGEKAEELASLEALDNEGEWCWPGRNGITRRGKRMDPRPAFHYLAEDDDDEQVSGGLNHLVPRHAGGAQLTWKKVTGGLGGGGERDAEERVSPNIHRRNKEVQAR